MADITIKTDNKYRDTLSWFDLTTKEQKEFDWMADSDMVEAEDADFVRYRGWVYYMGDFMRLEHGAPDEFKGWDGYSSDSYFSGVLVKYDPEDCGRVMMATYYS